MTRDNDDDDDDDNEPPAGACSDPTNSWLTPHGGLNPITKKYLGIKG